MKRTIGSEQNSVGALQLGPDGRIYVAKREGYLDVITTPNALGTACGYVTDAVYLKGRQSDMGLPNFPPYYFFNCENVNIDLGPNVTLCARWRGAGFRS